MGGVGYELLGDRKGVMHVWDCTESVIVRTVQEAVYSY